MSQGFHEICKVQNILPVLVACNLVHGLMGTIRAGLWIWPPVFGKFCVIPQCPQVLCTLVSSFLK